MPDFNDPNELKVPVLEEHAAEEGKDGGSEFDPELPPFLQHLDDAAVSPSSRLLLVALRLCGYLCALPPFAALFNFLWRCTFQNIFVFIASTVAFAGLALILFSLEKILNAIIAAHEGRQ